MLEIFLISAAWRKGWRMRALLPPAIAWPLVFVIGASSGADGSVGAIALIVIAELIALITMAVKAPAAQPVLVQPQVLELRYASERAERIGTGRDQ